jgi:outer membrane protein assembly factor BamB
MFGPVVDGDQVIAAFTDFGASPRGGGVVALHAVDGSLRWQVRFPRLGGRPAASAAGGPIVVRDLVAAASSDGTVYAFDRASGRVRWTVPPVARDPPHKAPEEPLTARNENAVSGAVGETEDVRPLASSRREIFAGSLSGVLCALEASTGRERWRFSSPSDGSIAFGITASGSVVYVPFASGRLVAVDSATGRKLWHAGGPEHRFEWPPVVGHHRAYLTTEDGLYAVAHHSN